MIALVSVQSRDWPLAVSTVPTSATHTINISGDVSSGGEILVARVVGDTTPANISDLIKREINCDAQCWVPNIICTTPS